MFDDVTILEEDSICSESGMELEMHYGSLQLLGESQQETLPCNTVKWSITIRQV